MAVTPAISSSQTTRLGCGRDVDQVWDTIDQPANQHERTCPYCTQARSELATLAAATNELRTVDQQDQNLRVPDQMLSNVLAIVRTEVRRGRTIPLQRRVSAVPASPDHLTGAGLGPVGQVPDLTVSELVIATVVRQICDRNPQVEARRVRIATSPAPSTAPQWPPSSASASAETRNPGGVEPTAVSIDLQVTVSHTATIPALIAGVRTAIQQAVNAQIGISVSQINVEVQDLHDA